ncbi:hypothetical protein IIZ72_01740 [Candidatus Saccharibacteria bacterium]|nr:hypothetical protein [Candidatus Saccharibacteria bacterium]
MFFDDLSEISKICSTVSCAIFVVPRDAKVEIKGAFTLSPDEKSVITIEQVKDLISRLSMRQVKEQYIIIRSAELLSADAANAFLKNLEEPKEKVHFVLVTDEPSRLLPTVLSRAAIYFLRQPSLIDSEILADRKVKDLAKKLMVARGDNLVKVAEEITAVKENKREFALLVVGVAIELLYKSYYITKKDVFVKKLPKFLELYENIEKNGHIKLHLVADLC